MNKEDLKRCFKQMADVVAKLFNKIIDAMKILLKTFKLDDPKFRHNYEMSRSSKKKRTRKKYAKKCIK